MTCVIEGGGAAGDCVLLGIITDGDLRRHMEHSADIMSMTAADVMTRNPVTLARSTLAAQALNIMEQRKITSIVVTDGDQPKQVAGVVHLHDLWRMDLF
jgi:arabinose-5-phosphate isomerase